MIKENLVDEVAKRSDLTRADAREVVDTILESIMAALNAGNKVELRGFGSFRQRLVGPTVGRNPMTGEPVHVPAKQVTHFKPGRDLIQIINRRG